MTPPMFQRLWDYFQSQGFTTNYTEQYFNWRDSGDLNERFMVFRPAGSTPIRQGMATEWHVRVDVVSGIDSKMDTTNDVQAIIDAIAADPMAFGCAGYITPVNGIPEPILTIEGRLVYRLLFSCLHGDD